MNRADKNAWKTSSFPASSRSQAQGFTLLELVVVIVIVSTLVSTLMVRVMPAIDEAERAAVLKLEGQLRSSLAMESARYVAAGDTAGVKAMAGMNPVSLMLDPPANYLGERKTSEIAKGHWYFANDRRLLVYRPGDPQSFEYRDRPREELEFTVELAYAAGETRERIYGVRLVRTRGNDWLEYQQVH
ncbi:MAG: prepilin-type N-terminal cleavage/methylation domain-containing protein [Pseudomonadota bacterium]